VHSLFALLVYVSLASSVGVPKPQPLAASHADNSQPKQGSPQASSSVAQIPRGPITNSEPPEKQRRTGTQDAVNVFIATAAIAQAIASFLMVCIYRKQSRLMARALAETKKAGNAAKGSADAANTQIQMVKDKERARLRVELDGFDMTPVEGRVTLMYRVILDGTTQAYVRGFECMATIAVTDSDSHQTTQSWTHTMYVPLPAVITPDNRTVHREQSVFATDFSQDSAVANVALIRQGKLDIYCRGWILYADIFDGIWRYEFSRRWTYNTLIGQLGGQGRWMDYGGQEANRETKEN
jgi:hypothetical protein